MAATLAGSPIPDSGTEEGIETNNSDWYRVGGEKRSSFNDFFDSLPHGVECLQHLEHASRAKRGKASAPYAGMTDGRRIWPTRGLSLTLSVSCRLMKMSFPALGPLRA
jgi:hypothetical protein